MGVSACDRNGCSNIMCNRYSQKYGYICDECFTELKVTRVSNIRGFMLSLKSNEDFTITDHMYNVIFPSRHEEDNENE